MMNWNNVAKRC